MIRRHACANVPLIHYPVKLFTIFPSGKSSSGESHTSEHRFTRRATARHWGEKKTKSKQFHSNEHPNNADRYPSFNSIVFGWRATFLCTQTTRIVNNICASWCLFWIFSSRQYCTHASASKLQTKHKMADYIDARARRNEITTHLYDRINAIFPE